jgi:hypothetical protein
LVAKEEMIAGIMLSPQIISADNESPQSARDDEMRKAVDVGTIITLGTGWVLVMGVSDFCGRTPREFGDPHPIVVDEHQSEAVGLGRGD